MIVYYMRNFCIGTSTHVVKVYESYTDENGCEGFMCERESTRIADCLRGLDMTPEQRATVKGLARDRWNGVVLESGEYKTN